MYCINPSPSSPSYVQVYTPICTSGRFDVVDSVAVQLEHVGRVGLALLVAADGEGVLRHLDQDKVAPLPLLPYRLPHGVHIPAGREISANERTVQCGVDQSEASVHCDKSLGDF